MLFISILSVTHWLVLCFLSSSLTLSWISRVFCTCSALFNFQDTVLDITFCWSHFRAATFILYHTFELLSSELFVNAFNISWSSARLCSLCFSFEILISLLQLLYYITSRFICQVNKLWTEISFCSFQSILCSTSQRNAYNLFFALSRLKLPLSLFPFRFAAPCSLHRCSSAFRFRFTCSFEFLNAAFPRATALLLYTLFPILSTLFLVEDFYWILSINCVIYTKQVVFNRFFRKMRGFLWWNGVIIVFFGKTLCVRFGLFS